MNTFTAGPSDRLLKHARRACEAQQVMIDLRRAGRAECERRKDVPSFESPPERCSSAYAKDDDPAMPAGFGIPSEKWCARCKAYEANKPKFMAAKRDLSAARRGMQLAWRQEKRT